jgi:hypothetical protein
MNAFDFLNKTSGQNCVKKSNVKYLGMEGVVIIYLVII